MNNKSELLNMLGDQCLSFVRGTGRRQTAPYLERAEKYFRDSISLDRGEIFAKTTLAEILVWTGRLDEAISLCNKLTDEIGFEQDVMLLRIIANINSGRIDEALRELNTLRKINPHSAVLQRYEGMCWFYKGDILSGWREVRSAFNFENLRVRYKNLQRWRGEDLTDKTLVITMLDIRGGGDEIYFASVLPSVIEKAKLCFIETDVRAFKLFESSFPNSVIFVKGSEPWAEMGIKVDYHTWTRELACALNDNRAYTNSRPTYLSLSRKDQSYWDDRIDSLAKGKLKIGICWTSFRPVGLKSYFYTSLFDWQPIFQLENAIFINMHGMDGWAEIKSVEDRFGVKIHTIEEADYFNKFHHMAGLANACDYIISAATTNGMIAFCSNENSIEIRPRYTSLYFDVLPWHPKHKRYYWHFGESYKDILETLACDLNKSLKSLNRNFNHTS